MKHGSPSSSDRQARIRTIVAECYERRSKGESLSDRHVMERHPDLMPELEQLLRVSRLAALGEASGDTPPWDGMRANRDNAPAGQSEGAPFATESSPEHQHDQSTVVSCPNCRSQTAARRGARRLQCKTCGNEFDTLHHLRDKSGLSAGQTIGRFELISVIGRGGFGTVWEARDPQLDRKVALKTPRDNVLTAAEAEYFLREARTRPKFAIPTL